MRQPSRSPDAAVLRVIESLLVRHVLSGGEALALVEIGPLATLPRRRRERMRVVARRVLVERAEINDFARLRWLAEALGEVLGEEIDLRALQTPASGVRARLVDVAAFLLFGCTGYLVLGALADGQSALVARPLPALLLFGALLSLLGLVEAMHVSVTQVRLLDLAGIRDQYPRLLAQQRRVRSQRGIEAFLGGRQVFVILTVFWMAQLTSFPALDHWPLTHDSLPSWWPRIASSIFFEHGVAGALFVLWVGQLAPQYGAARRARALQNLKVTAAFFRFAVALDALGLTRPARWLSGHGPAEARVPSSPELRFHEGVERIDGLGTLALKKRWTLGVRSTLHAESATVVASDGFELMSERGLLLQAVATSVRHEAGLLRSDDAPQPTQAMQVALQEERLRDGWRRLGQEYRLPERFQPGDVVLTDTELAVSFRPRVFMDAIEIKRPTKLISVRAELADGEPRRGAAKLRVYRVDEALTELKLVEHRELEVIQIQGRQTVSYQRLFPDVGTMHVVTWDG